MFVTTNSEFDVIFHKLRMPIINQSYTYNKTQRYTSFRIFRRGNTKNVPTKITKQIFKVKVVIVYANRAYNYAWFLDVYISRADLVVAA